MASRLPADLGSVSTGEGASDWGLGSGGWVQGCDGGCDGEVTGDGFPQNWGCLSGSDGQVLRGVSYESW